MQAFLNFSRAVGRDMERRSDNVIETLEEIRRDYAYQRNGFNVPANGSERLVRDTAQRKIDAINYAICAIQQDEVANG